MHYRLDFFFLCCAIQFAWEFAQKDGQRGRPLKNRLFSSGSLTEVVSCWNKNDFHSTQLQSCDRKPGGSDKNLPTCGHLHPDWPLKNWKNPKLHVIPETGSPPMKFEGKGGCHVWECAQRNSTSKWPCYKKSLTGSAYPGTWARDWCVVFCSAGSWVTLLCLCKGKVSLLNPEVTGFTNSKGKEERIHVSAQGRKRNLLPSPCSSPV